MNTESSSSKSVTTNTRMLGLSWRILRVASMPFTSGIWRSIKTTSGCRSAARTTASSPVVVSPTTSKSGIEASREIMPLRKSGWSSAMRMRRGSIFLTPWNSPWAVADGPAPGCRPLGTLDAATPSQLGRPFVHRGETNARATLRGDTDAVVHDLQRYIFIDGEAHDAALGPGMTYYVGKRLLRDAVDGHFGGRR